MLKLTRLHKIVVSTSMVIIAGGSGYMAYNMAVSSDESSVAYSYGEPDSDSTYIMNEVMLTDKFKSSIKNQPLTKERGTKIENRVNKYKEKSCVGDGVSTETAELCKYQKDNALESVKDLENILPSDLFDEIADGIYNDNGSVKKEGITFSLEDYLKLREYSSYTNGDVRKGTLSMTNDYRNTYIFDYIRDSKDTIKSIQDKLDNGNKSKNKGYSIDEAKVDLELLSSLNKDIVKNILSKEYIEDEVEIKRGLKVLIKQLNGYINKA